MRTPRSRATSVAAECHHNDHVCITPAQLADELHQEWRDALSKAEQDTMVKAALALGKHLFAALDAYGETHDISYGVITEALLFMRYCIEEEMREDEEPIDPDDLDG